MSLATEHAAYTIALIGNPNTGKSTLFGALSGVRQRTGNYPGVTVERKLGELTHAGRRITLVDLPGTYSLSARSPDEMIAVDVLLGRRPDVPPPDVVLCVVSADSLERHLYLVSQVLELGRPVVVALTMTDLAQGRGMEIDPEQLSRRLGVPVVEVQARRGLGLERLKDALVTAANQPPPSPPTLFPEVFQAEVEELRGWIEAATTGDRNGASGETRTGPARFPRYLAERLILDVGGSLERGIAISGGARQTLTERLAAARNRLADAGCPIPAIEAANRYQWAAKVLEGVVSGRGEPASSWGDRIDAILTHKIWGTILLALILTVMFNAVFAWAQIPMDAIESAFDALSGTLVAALPEGALRSLLVDGVLAGCSAILVFLPQIFILFFFLTCLEESGYLARAAYLMDRWMIHVGLSGRSFIPLLSSFACAIPGIMATRVIENRNDRLTTILIAPLMSCSARLPVYTLMIAAFIPPRTYLGGWLNLQGLTLLAMYLLGILVAAAMALLLKRTRLRGSRPGFLMELPVYRWPPLRVVVHRMFDRGWDFVQNAGTIIFAVSIVMWGLLYYPRLGPEELAPLVAEKQRLEQALMQEADDPSTPAEELAASLELVSNRIEGLQKRQSFLGRMGRWIEPAVRPLGWDWRIGSAVIAAFPAREIVVSTIGVIFDVGSDVEEGEGQSRLTEALQAARWPDTGRPLFGVPVALSIMVFFALCAQCASTLAVIGRETESVAWPVFTFVYMTTLAYLAALVTYQAASWLAA